jgi:hypothetical protein
VDPDAGILGTPLTPAQDGTENLTKSGDVVFENVPSVRYVVVQGMALQWIRCRLLTPIDSTAETTTGKVRAVDLPRIKELSAEFDVSRNDLLIEQAFFNNQKLDLTKDFYPFGEKPKFGDVLYLGSAELFSNPDASLNLHVELTNPMSADPGGPIPPSHPQGVKLSWEFWDGRQWRQLGVSGSPPRIRFVSATDTTTPEENFVDATKSFAESGDVKFKFPTPPQLTVVNGQKGFWVRARIIQGNYGEEAHVTKGPLNQVTLNPATYAPPAIRAITGSYSIQKQVQPEALLSYNDFSYAVLPPSESFAPFTPAATGEAPPALYFGFMPPTAAGTPPLPAPVPKFSDRSMSIYVAVDESVDGGDAGSALDAGLALSTWEYWDGLKWTKWTVRDETAGFHHSGLVRLLAPPDFAPRNEFGLLRYWVRARGADAHWQPRIQLALLNTTFASNGTTSSNESLGVSNGTPEQSFRTLATPVLAGQQLQVQEPRMPDFAEQHAIRAEEGDDAIAIVVPEGGDKQTWVRWHEVTNFNASRPRDRHYVLNRATGMVSFGDGTLGKVPPRSGKIRMASYRTGGGTVGNRPAFNITQLKTAVPFIEKVCNWVPAGGGGDTESNDALLERGARGLRHGGRAVTREDFEDLTRLASPAVARAKCIPLQDLSQGKVPAEPKPGFVSVIVVPDVPDPQPQPNSMLLDCVREYLEQWQTPAAHLAIVGPAYVRVDVQSDIAVEDPDTAADTELAVKLALGRYLHPLTGGQDGNGWAFGRTPHKSDLYALIEGVAGVGHVRDVQASMTAEPPGLEQTEHFLICSGTLIVRTWMQE